MVATDARWILDLALRSGSARRRRALVRSTMLELRAP
jgi:hypothetical protein